MLLSEFKHKLKTISVISFLKPDGLAVPKHFHITEVGQINKRFIDCGGTVRNENLVSMQLWESTDFWHQLEPNKLLSIIDLSINKLGIEDAEIEVEYQSNTIGKYHLEFDGTNFLLKATQTNCLAQDKCGIPPEKLKVNLVDLSNNAQSCCTPGGKCC